MPEDLPVSAYRPLKGADFLTVLLLFLPAASFASIHGGSARSLGIPGADLALYAHYCMIASFLVITLALSFGGLARWRHGIAMGVAFLWMLFPRCLLTLGSVSIPLSREMTHEEMRSFRHAFKIQAIQSSSSGEGDCLRLRRSDDREPVRIHLKSIDVIRAAPPQP